MHFAKLFTFVYLITSSLAVHRTPLTPSSGIGQTNTQNLEDTGTDSDIIIHTLQTVDQKAGAITNTAPPSNEKFPTIMTKFDSQVTEAGQSGEALLGVLPGEAVVSSVSTESVLERHEYKVTSTHSQELGLVPDDTYDVDGRSVHCDRINACSFMTNYYEPNHLTLNGTPTAPKCTLHSDVPTDAEKTNGGQQLLAPPAESTLIQYSSGYAVTSTIDPPVPEGYEYVFGPENAATNAPGYMGLALLDKYDIQTCANMCNEQRADPLGGLCKYFNIWHAIENGNPILYVCTMYAIPTDATTATFTGEWSVSITSSRGYKRINHVVDGGFEEYDGCSYLCYTNSYAHWTGTSPPGGSLDASIFRFISYAWVGRNVALLGSATGVDDLSGTLTSNYPLDTIPGRTYVVSFFQDSSHGGPYWSENSTVSLLWNGDTVATITPGYSLWTHHSFEVAAVGGDQIAFHGGRAPAYTFIDEVYVFLK